jgi:Tfp pilus assembly protein PilE
MKKRLPFTALELVLVCAVAAILLSISLPAFYNISAGRRITGAMSTIAANVSLARARAVSDNIYTALIFPSTADTLGLPADSKLANTSLRLAEVRKKKISDTSFEFVFVKWLDGSPWEGIGDGVVIPPDGATKNFREGDSADPSYPVSNVDFSDAGGSSSADVGRTIIFSPRGQILTGSAVTQMYIRAAEGSKVPGTTNFTLKKTGTETTYAVLTVNPLSGRTAVSYVSE